MARRSSRRRCWIVPSPSERPSGTRGATATRADAARGQVVSGTWISSKLKEGARRRTLNKTDGAHGARLPRGDFKVGPARPGRAAVYWNPNPHSRRSPFQKRTARPPRGLGTIVERRVARGEARAPRRRRKEAQGEGGGGGDGRAPAPPVPEAEARAKDEAFHATSRRFPYATDATLHHTGAGRAPRRNWKSSNANR